MAKIILVSLAVLTLSTSVGLAAQRAHHSPVVKPSASTAAMNPNPYARSMYPNAYAGPMNANAFAGPRYPNAFAGVGQSPVGWPGGVSSTDRDLYFKNLRDSGYNPKNNFNSNGTISTQ
jgi:hypothetical protein